MWKCPVCDTDLDDSVSFCPIDGTRRVEHKSSPVEAATWTCRACHTENDGLYCKNCGRKRTPAPGSAPRPQQGGAAARPAYQWVCAKCNAVNPDTALTCMRCRAPRDYDENAALRKQLHSMEAKKNGARVGAILLICAVLLLFSVPYIVGEYGYTVYHNIGGVNGDVEKACSIVALLFAIFPIPSPLIPWQG